MTTERTDGPRFAGTTPGRGNGRVLRRSSPAMAPAASGASGSLLSIAWRSRWLMAACLVLSLVVGVVYVQTATPIYTSAAKLYLDYSGIAIAPSYESGVSPRTDRYLYTQAELLVSRPTLGTVLETPEIRRMRTFADIDVPFAYLQTNMRVHVGRKDDIISVSFDSPYAPEAAQIVNAVVDAYMTSRANHDQKDSSQVLKILQAEMSRTTTEVNTKRDQLEAFQATGMPLALGSDQGSTVVPRYLELQATYTQAQTRTMEAEAFLQGVESLAEDPVALRQYLMAKSRTGAYGGATGEKTLLQDERVRALFRLDDLTAELMSDHPRISGTKREIERIDARLQAIDEQFVGAAVTAARQQHSEAEDYEADVARLFAAQREQVVNLNGELAQYARFRDEVTQLTEYARTVEQQIREIRSIVGEDIGQLRIAILEPALLAEEPSKPQKARVMTIALVLGLMSAGAAALLRDVLDQTLRSADEIFAHLGLPILGVIPAMERRQTVSMRGQKVYLQPDSPEAEAFRTVRTAVFFGASKAKAKTILVTSPTAGDGKSTMVSNLAVAMAQAEQRTILLDADFRKPMQHIIFGVDRDTGGIAAVLAGKAKLDDVILPTQVEGLSLLPCGANVPNPAELLNSDRFAACLNHLAEAYDRVIVDAPPVTVVTDAQILSAISNATILVLRADKSTRKVAQRAIDVLHSVGGDLLGVVVNGVRRNGDQYGYYGSYGRSQGAARGATARVSEQQGVHGATRARPIISSVSQEKRGR